MSHLPAGTVIGNRYRLLGHLGQGGMGTVYRAEHVTLGRKVALKLVSKDIAQDPGWAERFDREARTSALLDHPACVRVWDHGRLADGSSYLAMELLEGPTLAGVLARVRRFPIAHAVRAGRELLEALGHAHGLGILHRDVKPENVMYAAPESSSRIVLIDFGLARLKQDARMTATGMCVGSPSYVAPERLQSRPYDGRADLYSVGVILYELLTGVRPFRGTTPHEIVRRHVERPATPLRTLVPEVKPALEAVVMRALSKKPDERFATAGEMAAALEAAIAPAPRPSPAFEARGEVFVRVVDVDDEPGPQFARGTGSSPAMSSVRLSPDALVVPPGESSPTMQVPSAIELKPSLGRKVWGWLRYGKWRRRKLARAASSS